ncbi:MAG: coproporphyrinogen III oxidase [Prolixibacteraceae bacterium]|jgi:coproporphyrinogen III oxidase|nr:coproporphyrinogen III oxidase [Prolixibacteraceae bacterium]
MRTTEVAELYRSLQKQITLVLEEADGKAEFTEEHWKKDIGEGFTRVLQNGRII